MICNPAQSQELATRAMIAQVAKVLVGMGIFGGLASFCLDALGINALGFGALDTARNAVAITTFGLLIALFMPAFVQVRTALILLIPLLTQFYQVGLAWDFAVGPNSLIRVLPYVGIWLAMAAGIGARRPSVTQGEQVGWAISACIGLLGWVTGFTNGPTAAAGFFVFAGFLPTLYFFLKCQFELEPTGREQVIAAGFLGFLVLAVGAFLVIKLGSGMAMGGVSGLLGTRNVSDYNLIFTYLLLLWPIAVLGGSSLGPSAVGMLGTVFVASSIVGLSRTGAIMVPVLVLVSLIALFRGNARHWGGAAFAVLICGTLVYFATPGRETLGLVWGQRFNVFSVDQAGTIVDRIRPGGEDSAARDVLRQEAWRLWLQEPLSGQGFGGFGAASVRGYNDAHSLSFTTLSENGLAGLVSLYGLLGFLALRLIRLLSLPVHRTRSIYLISFIFWLISVHTVGGNLAVLSESGFNVNVINGVLLVLYLWVHRLVAFSPAPRLEAAS